MILHKTQLIKNDIEGLDTDQSLHVRSLVTESQEKRREKENDVTHWAESIVDQ
jgi:hypothetical protein